MIFYFSGTGNSLYAAKKIGTAIDDNSLINMAVSLKKGEFDYSVNDNENVGFVFPAYFSGLPTVVADFLASLNISYKEKPYIFFVITGGASIGGADRQFRKALNGRGCNPDCIFSLLMPANYIAVYNPPPESIAELIMKITDNRLNKIIPALKSKKVGGYKSNVTYISTVLTYPIYMHGRKTKRFYADSKCIGCSECVKICPVGAIELKNGKPQWVKDQCAHCVGCINRCPQKAIQYGAITKHRNRYINKIFRSTGM